MLHAGPLPPAASALAERLESAYYALAASTERHFGRSGEGWFLTGVAGLDAPTMNRAVVVDAPRHDVERVLDEAYSLFTPRGCSWSVVLPTFRENAGWHAELVSRGFAPSTILDVLIRPPGEIPAGPRADAVREARPEEVPHFVEMLIDVFRMPRRFYPALVDMTEAWRRAGSRLYFAQEEGRPVATALLSTTGRVGGIYNVGTLRGARRKGYAHALMARALADAKGLDLVTLQVSPEGFAESFYVGLGFEQLYSWRFYTPRQTIH